MRWLEIRQILAWADAYHDLTGKWPIRESGRIIGTVCETWAMVDNALRNGLRGLPGGSSLARLLAEHRNVRNIHGLPPLTIEQILAWADAHHRRTGEWPTATSGPIPDTPRETWEAINNALGLGLRGLPGGSSLARLLAEHRGVRNRKGLPPYTHEQILAWADLHYQRTGKWPTRHSGPIPDTNGETWMAVEMALCKGLRGLPKGSSLSQLLAEHRGVRRLIDLPRFSLPEILVWIDAHHARTGTWPLATSGPIPERSGETWQNVDRALRRGLRGLPGGSSLARLLAEQRGVRHHLALPRYTHEQILAWADAYQQRHGDWPTHNSGSIPEAPGETWAKVDTALRDGRRGLEGGSSLAQFLVQHRGKRTHLDLPRLTIRQILAWADAHYARTGAWPNVNSGSIPEAPEENWASIDNALRLALRGLPGGSSLARLLARKRGLRNPSRLPPLFLTEILAWADAYYHRHGKWPTLDSGPIPEAPGETWRSVDYALREGTRWMPGGSSLAKLLAEHRDKQLPSQCPPFQPEQIYAWAVAYRHQHGKWPSRHAGPIAEAPGETWARVDAALRTGTRGLPGGSSLAQFLNAYRPPESGPAASCG